MRSSILRRNTENIETINDRIVKEYFYMNNEVLLKEFTLIYNQCKQNTNSNVYQRVNSLNNKILRLMNNKISLQRNINYKYSSNNDFFLQMCIYTFNSLEEIEEFKYFNKITEKIIFPNNIELKNSYISEILDNLLKFNNINRPNSIDYSITLFIENVLIPILKRNNINKPVKANLTENGYYKNLLYESLKNFYKKITENEIVLQELNEITNEEGKDFSTILDQMETKITNIYRQTINNRNIIDEDDNIIDNRSENEYELQYEMGGDMESYIRGDTDVNNGSNNAGNIVGDGDIYNQVLARSMYDISAASETVSHIELNSNSCNKISKINIIKNIIYNTCGFIFDELYNVEKYNHIINIVRDEKNIQKFFDSLDKTNDKNTIYDKIYQQIEHSVEFESNMYNYFIDFLNNKANNKLSYINFINQMNHLNKDIDINDEKTRNEFVKSHIPYFLFFLIEKRKHYVENHLTTDLLNLKNILKDNKNVIKINSTYNIITKFIKKNDEKRTKLFEVKKKYEKENTNCYIFFCSICSVTECDPDESDPDDSNCPSKFFTVLNCGHSLHRECAREYSKTNKKSKVLKVLKNNEYVKCALCLIECPSCRKLSYIYY